VLLRKIGCAAKEVMERELLDVLKRVIGIMQVAGCAEECACSWSVDLVCPRAT